MNLPSSLSELLVPKTTRTVCVTYHPTRRPNEIRIRVAPMKALQFDLGCVLEGNQAETLTSIRRQLEARRYWLDEPGSSEGKLVFRYQEER